MVLIDPHDEDLRDRLLTLGTLRKWVRVQEGAIEQARLVAAAALEAKDLAQALAALQLVTRAQAELIALVAPKRTAAKSEAAPDAEPDVEDHNAPITPSPPAPDFSKMSDEEVERLARVKPSVPSVLPSVLPSRLNPEPKRRGRPKGHPVSGATKEAKEHAQARLERGQRKREAQWHPAKAHDAAVAWPMPIPEEWDD